MSEYYKLNAQPRTFDVIIDDHSVTIDVETHLSSVNSMTGNPVVIQNDSAEGLGYNAVVKILPSQNLNGFDYPWFPGGGKNLLPYPYVDTTKTDSNFAYTDNGDGSIAIRKIGNGTSTFRLYNGLILDEGTYTLKGTGDAGCVVALIDTSSQESVSAGEDSTTFTVSDDGTEFTASIYCNGSNVTFDTLTVYPQVERGNQSTEWVQYLYSNICPISGYSALKLYCYIPPVTIDPKSGEPIPTKTFTVSLSGTAGVVYGGTIDFHSGVLTVTGVCMTFDGSENGWYRYTANNSNGTCFYINQIPYMLARYDYSASHMERCKAISNEFAMSENGQPRYSQAGSFWYHPDGDKIRFIWGKPNMGSTVAEFKAFLNIHHVQVYAPLQTPIVYKLSSFELGTLQPGTNTISTNAGEVTVTYYLPQG